ncbi:MAG TPA: prolyl oligopeptidase family serine peptidase [Thermomicrobiales bacterium]|nr:prolyl oligopeptidase family serine peptidase [Thermomicrobiales bacterium]
MSENHIHHRERRLNRRVYERAEQWKPGNRANLVRNMVTSVRWLADGSGLVYTATADDGTRDVRVDFTNMSRQTISPDEASALSYRTPPCHLSAQSPDGKHTLGLTGFDLQLTDHDTGETTRLTFDGTEERSYGTPGRPEQTGNHEIPIIAIWSPDSRYVLTQRMDYRGVRATPITESAPPDGGLPRVHQMYTPFPGDEHIPLAELMIVDANQASIVPANIPPLPCTHSTPLMRQDIWWEADSSAINLIQSSRTWQSLTLRRIEPATGASRDLVTETSDRRLRPAQMFHQKPNVRLLRDADGNPSEVIWFSERDGWGHLYLYDAATGECIRQLTRGDYVVQEILRVDQQSRIAWINISGLIEADPYRYTTCRLDLDTGKLDRLVEDSLDHRQIGLLPDAYEQPLYVDVASTVSEPPVSTLRDWDGQVVLELERADVTPFQATGWRPPERFQVAGSDGTTPIYGTIFFPPDFDPNESYPVLDHLYPGPQRYRSLPFFAEDEIEPMTAIGLVGVTVDGRGTPGRSRHFNDASWRNLGAGSGLADHVAAIRELAKTRPWMDLTRVGVFGHSAGGYAATLAMEQFPDFFTVGIASAGRHEGRMVMAMILEAYDSPDDAESWARASAVTPAGDITGKLLLVHGEMDKAVSIHHTYRVIERLIAANRDYDLLWVPGADHTLSNHEAYVERRQWDYLARNLVGAEPPPGYEIGQS